MSGSFCGSVPWLQILRDGFDSRLEPIAFDIFTGWLLTRRAQAYFTVSLNYCSIIRSINLIILSVIYFVLIDSTVVHRVCSCTQPCRCEEGGRLYTAQTSGSHECRSESGRGNGRKAGPGGWIHNSVRCDLCSPGLCAMNRITPCTVTILAHQNAPIFCAHVFVG